MPFAPPGGAESPTVVASLRQVRAALAAHGVEAFSGELTTPESLVAVTSTVAPGLERFSLVRHGHPVVPVGRGRSLWPADD